MRVIHVSNEFPLNRQMRKAVRRGKLQILRIRDELSPMGGGISPEMGRAFRTHRSAAMCMVESGAKIGGNGADCGNIVSIQDTLNHMADQIRSHANLLGIEQNVRRTIIEPILQMCGWDVNGLIEVQSEFSVGDGRVDYALFCPDGIPHVFVEVKRLGGLDTSGEEQLFRYAYRQGVPILILTDGDLWDFYLSTAVGIPAERLFFQMKLTSGDKIPRYAEIFDECLQKKHVCSGQAVKVATELRGGVAATRAISRVWQSMLAKPDEMLRDSLAEEIARDVGQRPDLDAVENFLKNAANSSSSPRQPQQRRGISAHLDGETDNEQGPSVRTRQGKKIIGFIYRDQRVNTGAANLTLAEVLKAFHKENPDFMRQMASAPDTIGRTRRLIAHSLQELYDVPHMRKYHTELDDDWLMATNLSAAESQRYIELACKIAGVQFGVNLTLISR